MILALIPRYYLGPRLSYVDLGLPTTYLSCYQGLTRYTVGILNKLGLGRKIKELGRRLGSYLSLRARPVPSWSFQPGPGQRALFLLATSCQSRRPHPPRVPLRPPSPCTKGGAR